MTALTEMSDSELAVVSVDSFATPTIIARAGPSTRNKFFEFFTVPIRNANTRDAYYRAIGKFLAWAERAGYQHLEDKKAANSGADKPVCDVEALRPSIKKESDLAGSTPLQNRPLVEWKWSIGGFVLLLFAFALGLWRSSLGSPSEDQRSLLAWALSLASGCSAGAFAASLSARTRHWFPGILITGSVGFVGWLMTFFYLFSGTDRQDFG